MKAGRSESFANQPLPIPRKARLGSSPSLNEDAESLPTLFEKSISSGMTGEVVPSPAGESVAEPKKNGAK